jgi:hypothetical protein
MYDIRLLFGGLTSGCCGMKCETTGFLAEWRQGGARLVEQMLIE